MMASTSTDQASWLICTACGTQFPTSNRNQVTTCFICDDPRQFTPPSGQAFTTHSDIVKTHKNEFHTYAADDRLTFIFTTPKLGIGQQAILIKTEYGNVLWDCITLLDEETINKIRELGGLKAIVISHPHYYSTHVQWARTFDCPVYLSAEDKKWITMENEKQVFLTEREHELVIDGHKTGVMVLKLGGHYPGSNVLLFNGKLMIADTLGTSPAGLGSWKTDAVGNARTRPKGMNSYNFMWSYPNMIPLPPNEVISMWEVLKKYDFKSTHGAFNGYDIDEPDVKQRVLDSMQIQVRYMGYGEHAFLLETLG